MDLGGGDTWRKAGRCSSCSLLAVDFGDPPDIYGHCKMYLRSGSRRGTDFACQQYEPASGFEALTKSADIDRRYTDPTYFKENRTSSRRSGGGTRSRYEPPPKRSLPPASEAFSALLGEGEDMDKQTIREVLLNVIESFIGVEDVEISSKWLGGTIEVKPGDSSLQSTEIPIDTLFKKVVSVRNQLRVLESKINGHDSLGSNEKIDLQQYISRCYGSLTTFNILFKNKEDKFSSR